MGIIQEGIILNKQFVINKVTNGFKCRYTDNKGGNGEAVFETYPKLERFMDTYFRGKAK